MYKGSVDSGFQEPIGKSSVQKTLSALNLNFLLIIKS